MLIGMRHWLKALTEGVTPFDWLMFGAEALVIALIFFEIVAPRLSAARRRRLLKRSYAVRLPVTAIPVALRAQQVVMASVVVNFTTTLVGFNIRFVTEQPKRLFRRRPQPTNVDPGVIEIIGVNFAPGSNEQLATINDREGGFDCEFITPYYNQSPRTIRGGKTIELRLIVVARQAWEGSVSFEALDADGTLQRGRARFQVLPE